MAKQIGNLLRVVICAIFLSVNTLSPALSQDTQALIISKIDFVGNSLVSDDNLNQKLSSFFGRSLVMQDIADLVSKVGFAYREYGHWAAAYLPEQTVSNGVLTVGVIEAKTGDFSAQFETERSKLTEEDLFEVIMMGQEKGQFLDLKSLEYGIKKANAIPGVFVAAELDEGQVDGATDIKAYVQDMPILNGSIILDNHVADGDAGRLGLRLGLESPLGYGEQFNLTSEKTQDTFSLDFGSSIGLQNETFRAGLDIGYSDYSLGGAFAPLKIKGEARKYEVKIYDIDLYERDSNSPKLDISFNRTHMKDYILGTKKSDKSIQAIDLKIDIPLINKIEEGKALNLSVLAKLGRVDLGVGSSAFSLDQSSRKTHGDFALAIVHLSGKRNLSERNVLTGEIQAQFAKKNLDGSHKLNLSGPTALRSLNVGAASADTGMWGNFRLSHTRDNGASLYAFLEGAKAKLNAATWSGWDGTNPSVKNDVYAFGGGLGVYLPFDDALGLELVAAKLLETNIYDVEKHTRFWAQATYKF